MYCPKSVRPDGPDRPEYRRVDSSARISSPKETSNGPFSIIWELWRTHANARGRTSLPEALTRIPAPRPSGGEIRPAGRFKETFSAIGRLSTSRERGRTMTYIRRKLLHTRGKRRNAGRRTSRRLFVNPWGAEVRSGSKGSPCCTVFEIFGGEIFLQVLNWIEVVDSESNTVCESKDTDFVSVGEAGQRVGGH